MENLEHCIEWIYQWHFDDNMLYFFLHFQTLELIHSMVLKSQYSKVYLNEGNGKP